VDFAIYIAPVIMGMEYDLISKKNRHKNMQTNLRLRGGRRVVNFRKAEFFVNILAFLLAGSNVGLDWKNAGVKAKNGQRKGRKESLIFDHWK
jgi:hypothetical protein